MSISLILIIILVVLLVGAIPAWPYSRAWGGGPSGALAIILLIVILLAVFGKL